VRIKLGVFAVAAMIFGLFVGTENARAAGQPAENDACAMVSPADWSKALGVKMGEGKHTTETYVKTCTWNTAEKATPDLKFVTLDLQTTDRFDAGKRAAMGMMQATMNYEVVSELGDDAYFLSAKTDKITELFVKKGSGAFKVAIYGDMPTDKKKAAAKEIAGEVVGKM
jgi:hypothetical protein